MKKLSTLLDGVLISENKLYPKKLIDGVTKKINDSSDATLNKLAIAGLYRNFFGNVQQLKSKEQLDSVFNDWRIGMINKMIKTEAFIENRDLATKYLDAYIKNIKSLGDQARPFSLKKIEAGLVDLVNDKGWIKDQGIKQDYDIYTPKEGDIVHEDKNIIILDTNTKAKCVTYGRGESWCITKPELNYYNTYRIQYGATPYFVLQKKVKKPEHKLVIMHYPNGYSIADQSNSGKRSGSKTNVMSWDGIEKELPNLKGMEKFFPYREITKDEKKYSKITSERFEGNNLQKYIDDTIDGLVINGSEVEAVDFIRDYSATGFKITDSQIKTLRPEILDSLIEGGYFLTSNGTNQTYLLSEKQQLRVIRLKVQNNIELNGNEILLIPENEQKEVIESLNTFEIPKLIKYTDDQQEMIQLLVKFNEDAATKFKKPIVQEFFNAQKTGDYDKLNELLDSEDFEIDDIGKYNVDFNSLRSNNLETYNQLDSNSHTYEYIESDDINAYYDNVVEHMFTHKQDDLIIAFDNQGLDIQEFPEHIDMGNSSFDAFFLADLITNADVEEDVRQAIANELQESRSEAENKAGRELSLEASEHFEMWRNEIDKNTFLGFLYTYDEYNMDNFEAYLEDSFGLITEYYHIYEYINEKKWEYESPNMDTIVEVYDDIEDKMVEWLIETYEDEILEFQHETSDEETSNWFTNISADDYHKLKDELEEEIYDTIKNNLGTYKTFDYDINRSIEVFDKKINIPKKQVFIKFEDKKGNRDFAGYVNISDLPRYLNYGQHSNEFNTKLDKILTDLKLDPSKDEFENELYKLKLDRNKTDEANGKIFIELTNKDKNSTTSGMVGIESLPTHFTNYKLFETLLRFRDLL